MEGYSRLVDVWSVGCISFLLLRGQLPFDAKNKEDVIEKTLHKELFFDPKWDSISDTCKDLLKSMLSKDPRKRLSVDECLDHQWFEAHPRVSTTPKSVDGGEFDHKHSPSVEGSIGTPRWGPIILSGDITPNPSPDVSPDRSPMQTPRVFEDEIDLGEKFGEKFGSFLSQSSVATDATFDDGRLLTPGVSVHGFSSVEVTPAHSPFAAYSGTSTPAATTPVPEPVKIPGK